MTYLPSDYISSDNFYSMNNDIISVYSHCNDNNCICNDIYIKNDYIVSNDYNCSLDNIISIPTSSFTSNYYYRLDFLSILLIFLILCFIIIYCPLKIILRFFRRFDF